MNPATRREFLAEHDKRLHVKFPQAKFGKPAVAGLAIPMQISDSDFENLAGYVHEWGGKFIVDGQKAVRAAEHPKE